MQQVPHAHLRFVVDDVLVVAELLRGVPLDFPKWHFRVERSAVAASKVIARRIREESRLGIGPQNAEGADAVLAGKLAVLDAAELPAAKDDLLQPDDLCAGDVLLYDYRVVHRGPANDGPRARPIFYSVWADPGSAGDGYNFPERSLADLERRASLFGLRE